MCPRHPDRESYVRCQRCERPVCPQCQRQAAVGVQCVDCVSEGSRTVRQARTTFGGRLGDGRPRVTFTLIGVCAVVFVLQLSAPVVTPTFSFVPALAGVEPWRFLTSAFLHSPSLVLHIAFNMYALWLLGSYLEHLLGRSRFAALYLVSALGGSVGYLVLADPTDPRSWFSQAVGASGAVFGLFGALVVVNRKLGRQLGQIVVLIGINGVLGFVVPGIAWEAHLGGLVTGAAVAAVMAYAPRGRRTEVQVTGTAAVAVLLVALAALKLATV